MQTGSACRIVDNRAIDRGRFLIDNDFSRIGNSARRPNAGKSSRIHDQNPCSSWLNGRIDQQFRATLFARAAEFVALFAGPNKHCATTDPNRPIAVRKQLVATSKFEKRPDSMNEQILGASRSIESRL
ncbi:MAG: hypothetical protein KGK01_08950 [Bradyrhizobium sp.]|uniref:hypothetical protein n=1 Tax=Bradyrhizobium sp. TaxID=376 RepID=UPI001C29C91C|nr:hypothetical protein [Bradyrhizobium sp.]MBU6461460.1 hypothetical protein [Pseudomonadota bacterium]MDE2068522.1 hypothetical protein [Bradyrhizobium sp.]MDE2242553.1 hypothetical protein [Bradyrhizobium sp.]MDE2472217.1 hypothetical protein [Bradyrhizobium sp.]